jgi:hypothetical protein
MDLYSVIRELVQERDRVQRIIESLEGVSPPSRAQPVRSGVERRGRKSMDHAARQEVSQRMKSYWAQRRGQKKSASD